MTAPTLTARALAELEHQAARLEAQAADLRRTCARLVELGDDLAALEPDRAARLELDELEFAAQEHAGRLADHAQALIDIGDELEELEEEHDAGLLGRLEELES